MTDEEGGGNGSGFFGNRCSSVAVGGGDELATDDKADDLNFATFSIASFTAISVKYCKAESGNNISIPSNSFFSSTVRTFFIIDVVIFNVVI